jgi:hypothetical protein
MGFTLTRRVYPGSPRPVLTELLTAKLFPEDQGPADPADAASSAGMAKAELQLLCVVKGLGFSPVECPADEAAAGALGHEDVKRVLRRVGLKTTGALVDARRRLVGDLFPATPEDAPALLRLSRVSLQRLCVALAVSEEGSDEDLRGRLKENLGFVPQYDRRTLRERLGNVSLSMMEALLTYIGGPAVLTSADLLEMRAVIKETQLGTKGVPGQARGGDENSFGQVRPC